MCKGIKQLIHIMYIYYAYILCVLLYNLPEIYNWFCKNFINLTNTEINKIQVYF